MDAILDMLFRRGGHLLARFSNPLNLRLVVRDMKVRVMVETFGQAEMAIYAEWCGRALALSHARSRNSATLSGYMGKSDAFDKAIAAFSIAYADQNEKDHDALERAVRAGKVEAVFEEPK